MLSEERLMALEAEHKKIKHVVYNGVDLVFRKPKRSECREHAAKLEDPAQKPDADDQLAQQIIVQCGIAEGPMNARAAFLALLDEYPYLTKSAAVGNALGKLTGVLQDEDAKSYGSKSTGNAAPPINTPAG
jgi:hypothetical protein